LAKFEGFLVIGGVLVNDNLIGHRIFFREHHGLAIVLDPLFYRGYVKPTST
jgi:hypothetical protein